MKAGVPAKCWEWEIHKVQEEKPHNPDANLGQNNTAEIIHSF